MIRRRLLDDKEENSCCCKQTKQYQPEPEEPRSEQCALYQNPRYKAYCDKNKGAGAYNLPVEISAGQLLVNKG